MFLVWSPVLMPGRFLVIVTHGGAWSPILMSGLSLVLACPPGGAASPACSTTALHSLPQLLPSSLWQQHHGNSTMPVYQLLLYYVIGTLVYHSALPGKNHGASHDELASPSYQLLIVSTYMYMYVHIYGCRNEEKDVIKPQTYGCSGGQPWSPKMRDRIMYTHNMNTHTPQEPGRVTSPHAQVLGNQRPWHRHLLACNT